MQSQTPVLNLPKTVIAQITVPIKNHARLADKRGANIPVRTIKLTEYRIDSPHSNAYEVWTKMGSPQSPTTAQISILEKAGQLQTMAKNVHDSTYANSINPKPPT